MDTCPYCKKEDCIPDTVVRNTEGYGANRHHFRCEHCNKVITGYFKRTVVLMSPGLEKSKKTQGDWG